MHNLPKILPKVSFIIPTLNAEKYLDLCLGSVFKQDYPKDKIEVLIIDGGSNDDTINISQKYPVKVLSNEKRIAEYGKYVGIKECSGDYFILLDSDNEIVEGDWLLKMVSVIKEDTSLFGVESDLSHDAHLSSLNRYFGRMRIADPLARCLVSRPVVENKDSYKLLKFKDNAIIITGANGFLWNKDLVLKTGGWQEKFEEANYGTYIHRITEANYAIPKDASIRHYYCDSFSDYILKRKKIALKMKGRMEREQKNLWTDQVSRIKFILSVIYLGTFLGPAIEAIYRSIKDRTTDWLWHPAVSFVTILIYTYNYVK